MKNLEFRVSIGNEHYSRYVHSSDYPCLSKFFEFVEFHNRQEFVERFTGFFDKDKRKIFEEDSLILDGFSPELYRVKFDMGQFFLLAHENDRVTVPLDMIEDSTGNCSRIA